MDNSLTTTEARELEECENGIMDCVENIGMYLLRIRDKRLYRATHPSFEQYTKERFGIAKSRAYEHIEAAQVKLRLSVITDVCPRAAEVTVGSQLRKLADVPEEKLPQVIDKAFEESPRPTAKDFEAAKRVVCSEPVATTCLMDDPALPSNDKPVDYVLERAKAKLDEHLRGVILQFGHLGLGGQADSEVKALRRKAGL